jgi:hypothetical protein
MPRTSKPNTETISPKKKKPSIKKDFSLKINASFDDVLKIIGSGAGVKKTNQ